MLKITTSQRDLYGNKLPNNEFVKEYTITQGDTFTLHITDENNVVTGARFILGTDAYTEIYSRAFSYDSENQRWTCIVPTVDTNSWAISLTEDDSNPYIYEIEATLNDGNKISITKYYFNVTNQVGDN